MSLKHIYSQKISKTIDKPYIYTIIADKSALYLIEITASAKSHGQRLSFNKQADDELKLQLGTQPNLFQNQKSAIWNGNQLKNLKKTIVFIIYLEKGNHQWKLIPKNKPYIEQINVYQTQDNKIEYNPTINNPAQDGDRRPWYSFVFINLDLINISVQAKVKKQVLSFDDDDLKIVINNGDPIKNETKKSHKDWFWCGKILKGQSKEFTRELNCSKSIYTIDLYADRTPLLEKVNFELYQPFQPIPRIKPYNKIDQNDYNRFDHEIINAVIFWNNEFSKQKFPPTEPLNPNLIKAMIYIETRMGYGSGSNQAYPDVMQVWDEANNTPQTIKGLPGFSANEFISKTEYGHMSYNYPKDHIPPKVENPNESIFWGVRWLYNKAQDYYGTGVNDLNPPYTRKWITWKQALLVYNANAKLKEGYQKDVIKILEKGEGPKGEKLW